MNAVGALALLDAERLARTADVAAALSMEALHGVPYAYDARTHALRPFRGQNAVASNLRRLIEGSGIVERYKKDRVQDAYSLHYVRKRIILQPYCGSRSAGTSYRRALRQRGLQRLPQG